MQIKHYLRPRIDLLPTEPRSPEPDLIRLNKAIKQFLTDLETRCDPIDFDTWSLHHFGWSRTEIGELLVMRADVVRQTIRRVEREKTKLRGWQGARSRPFCVP